MKLLLADFILTCNTEFEVIHKGAIAFDEHIIDIGSARRLTLQYPDATHLIAPPNSVVLPGLINAHVHLEFSANESLLHYGEFIPWLKSVIKHREMLSEMATTQRIAEVLAHMLRSGTTSLGAISSFGADLEACAQTSQRVVYFNEVLGSTANTADIMYADFISRYHASMDEKSATFFPAVAIHSPYSTHPILAKKAIELSYKDGTCLSTHFMESQAERTWLDKGEGEFASFLTTFNPHAKPLCSSKEYLELFKHVPTLFTHCVHATAEELSLIADMKGSITHCPVSNRLLGVGALDINEVQEKEINLTLATDGLSSNFSLSLWDEMRSCLMMHPSMALNSLAETLLKGVTCNAAHALRLNCGVIEKEKYADLIVATLPQELGEEEDLVLQLILHTKQPHWTIMNGEIQ